MRIEATYVKDLLKRPGFGIDAHYRHDRDVLAGLGARGAVEAEAGCMRIASVYES